MLYLWKNWKNANTSLIINKMHDSNYDEIQKNNNQFKYFFKQS